MSTIDLIWVNPAAAVITSDCWVAEDTEPGSDHMYVILATSAVPPPRAPRAGRRPPRWALKRLDIDAARLASSVVAWPPLPGDTLDDPAAGALWLRGALHSICDASMPRAGNTGQGSNVGVLVVRGDSQSSRTQSAGQTPLHQCPPSRSTAGVGGPAPGAARCIFSSAPRAPWSHCPG